MIELRIILRRWVTFTARVTAGWVFSVLPILNEWKGRSLAEIGAVEWSIIFLTGLGNAANTAAAWFSTSADSARKEVAEAKP